MLKARFIKAPILIIFDLELKTIIETDALYAAILAVLLQIQANRTKRLVTYYFKKLHNTELKYNIYNKELIAIIKRFKK